jgi:two-component system sensor histidine kinase BaeS
MKTRIFLAFMAVILCALASNFIFESLILKDFDDYAQSVKEDNFYWIASSIEESYSEKGWNMPALSEAIHWAMMLGIDIKITDVNGKLITTSKDVMHSLPGSMKERMQGMTHLHGDDRLAESYPIYSGKEKIGTITARPYHREEIAQKEFVFKKRVKHFQYISLAIAAAGAFLLAIALSRYISKPVINLRIAAETISSGEFNVSVKTDGKGDIGKLADTFNKMAGSLKREAALRKRLMSNVAHELRTPLTVIRTHIEAVEDGVIESSRGIDKIKDETNRLIELINGIEDITAAEASFFSNKESMSFNLQDFLKGIAEDMRHAFLEKGLSLKLADKGDVIVNTDSDKLEKIVRNIIINAAKFTDDGGAFIDYGVKDNDFYIAITDTGRGIADEELPLIFNRFYRAAGNNSRGLGLGLAIVKELLSVMGGRIEASSSNKGSAFTIYLPNNS